MTELNQISSQFIHDTWESIATSDDEPAILEMSQRYSQNQPALAEFALSSLESLSEEAIELGYYLGFVSWKCYDSFYNSKLSEITPEEIEEQAENVEEYLKANSDNDKPIESLLPESSQKNIWEAIVSSVLDPDDDEIELDVEEEASLLSALKVHIDCLEVARKQASH